MTFELEADGVHFSCSSPVWTRKLVDKGARLIDESQAEALRHAIESTDDVGEPAPESQPAPRE